KGERVSSSAVRNALLNGDVDRAQAYLGRPYRLSGTVVVGKRLGPIFKKNGNHPFICLILEMGGRWATRRLGSVRRSA
ncbi:MAG: hypothetical protein II565_13565, partial [Fibrobacter sp.]|nr:hypothetical protein [Fibrobacter sp.]